MQISQGQLTILNAHTLEPQVFWNGLQVQNVKAIAVINGKVSLTLPEDPVLAEMKAAGIVIKREVV
jgi:hypothetical protein